MVFFKAVKIFDQRYACVHACVRLHVCVCVLRMRACVRLHVCMCVCTCAPSTLNYQGSYAINIPP